MLSEDKAMCIALVNDTDALLTVSTLGYSSWQSMANDHFLNPFKEGTDFS